MCIDCEFRCVALNVALGLEEEETSGATKRERREMGRVVVASHTRLH